MTHSRWLLIAGLGVVLTGCGKEASKPQQSPPPLAIPANRPPLEIVAGDGRLGSADFGEKKQCAFTLRNNASVVLRLNVAEKSCTCAGVRMDPAELEPGETGTVTLLWTPKAEVLETTTIRLWTELRDQAGTATVRLEATGTLEPKIQFVFPRGPLDFGRLDRSELDNPAKVLGVEVYSTQAPFQLTTTRSTLEGLDLVGNPVALSPDRLAELKAKAGYRLNLKPTPRLPAGRFNGHVQLATSLSPQMLELPMTGSFETGVVSLSSERIELPPRLNIRQGYRVPPLTLTIRQGTCTKCEVQSVFPALFQTKVHQLDEKSWRIELTLPPGLDAGQVKLTADQWAELFDFGFERGTLTLKLDHPEVKTLHIPLSATQLTR